MAFVELDFVLLLCGDRFSRGRGWFLRALGFDPQVSSALGRAGAQIQNARLQDLSRRSDHRVVPARRGKQKIRRGLSFGGNLETSPWLLSSKIGDARGR